jgi:hypothetical protein
LSERPQRAEDVKQRVRRYVTELGQGARPAVHGAGWNEKLAVTWPYDITMMQLMAALWSLTGLSRISSPPSKQTPLHRYYRRLRIPMKSPRRFNRKGRSLVEQPHGLLDQKPRHPAPDDQDCTVLRVAE